MKFLSPIFTNDCEASILFRGEPYFVKFEIKYDDDGVPDTCEILEFYPTKQPLDISYGYRGYVKWGWYPDFRQSAVIPCSDDNRRYDFLCTVDNHWGDSGTCNIFVLVKRSPLGYEIEDVYMEA